MSRFAELTENPAKKEEMQLSDPRMLEIYDKLLDDTEKTAEEKMDADSPEAAGIDEQKLTHSEAMEKYDQLMDGTEEKCETDDNGKVYRIGNDLLPNITYEINGYVYETDDKGRIISAEGTLRLKERTGRLPIKDSMETIGKGDELHNDDRGHLIGDQFDGSNELGNLIPQDANINRNEFKNFENELAQAVKDGKNVYVEIDVCYDEDSRRPEALLVTYEIDGETSVRIFPNGGNGNE